MSTGPYSRCTNPIGKTICGGEVDWQRFPDRWRGTCRSCLDQRRASSGEAAKREQHSTPSVE